MTEKSMVSNDGKTRSCQSSYGGDWVYPRLMPELLGLTELKKRAKAAGYTKISRLADLVNWNGFMANPESGFAHAEGSYILNGNSVIVRKMGKADIYYGLS
jgi:hypothetical protein